MAFPVVIFAVVNLFRALVGRLIARAAAVRGLGWLANGALMGWSLGNPDSYREFLSRLYEMVVAMFAKGAGINLDPRDPFSDRSMCNAIGEKTGVALRTVKDRGSIRADVERWALAQLEGKTGLHVRNIHDGPGVVKDVMKFASPVIADATGIPLSDISDADRTRGEIQNYLQDRALVVLAQDVERVRVLANNALESVGTSLEAMAQKIAQKSGVDPVTGLPNIQIDATLIALGLLSRALIAADKRRREEATERNKASRRREQVRAAVRRFRAAHGSRTYYERVP